MIALAPLAIHLMLPEPVSYALAALLLSMIAGVYLGFAFLDGRPSRIIVGGVVACLFLTFATWALVRNPMLLPLGYLAHALWDFLHHTPVFNVQLPRWYIPACVVVDVLVGFGLWMIWIF